MIPGDFPDGCSLRGHPWELESGSYWGELLDRFGALEPSGTVSYSGSSVVTGLREARILFRMC
ncbi:MAG: hypothetical protein JWN00_4465 [Actinomycetia bacterium]|nr:hypothetical protein [Actinomycetes bacterium]